MALTIAKGWALLAGVNQVFDNHVRLTELATFYASFQAPPRDSFGCGAWWAVEAEYVVREMAGAGRPP